MSTILRRPMGARVDQADELWTILVAMLIREHDLGTDTVMLDMNRSEPYADYMIFVRRIDNNLFVFLQNPSQLEAE